ncbi:Auto transporter, partial [Pseudomonas syringae pv. aceris]
MSCRENNVVKSRGGGFQLAVIAFGALANVQVSAAASGDNSGLTLDSEIVSRVLPDEELRDENVRRGEIITVGPDTPFDSYNIGDQSVLNILGGRADRVVVRDGKVNIESGVVESGISLTDALGNLSNATVKNATGVGIVLQGKIGAINPGSSVSAHSSEVSGSGYGIAVGSWGALSIFNTDVRGFASQDKVGQGIFASGSNVLIADNSHVTGDMNGINLVDGSGNGVVDGNKSVTVIDRSIVEGLGGAAIKVNQRVAFDIEADIAVQNQSELWSGNGNLLEVEDHSTANFNVDNSTLNGNLVADDTSTLNITLQNGAQLNGDIVNGNRLAITSGSHWQMQGDNAVRSLSLHGGRVSFAGEGFHTLSLNELSGGGTFGLRVDLDNGVGDLIDVNGQASGQFGLRVRNTGEEVVSADMAPLKV